jgi:chaperonin GroEL
MNDLGIELDKIELSSLGRAKKLEITSDNTVIIEGAGTTKDIQSRVTQIRNDIDRTDSDYDREKLQERLAKLAGGVAQINVGAGSEAELKEKKARIEDALHATRAAVAEGVVAGGGLSFIRGIAALAKARKAARGDEKFGVDLLGDALRVPLQTIADNAGEKGTVIVAKVAELKGNNGFNALTLEYGDLLDSGVITPAKVDRTALQNAASVACLLLTTDCAIVDAPVEEEEGGGQDHHDHGMGGMDPMGGMGGMGGMPGMGGMGF